MTIENCSHDLLRSKLEDKRLLQDIAEVLRCPGCGECFRPKTDGFGMDWYLEETIDPREWMVEDTKERKLMGAGELREHLKEKSQEHVGTSDLEEGNRRYAVLHEWRRDP